MRFDAPITAGPTIIAATWSGALCRRLRASFRKNEFALAKVPRVGSHRGLIFASLSATGPSLDEHLGPAKRLIDQFVDLSPEGEVVVSSGVLKHSYQGQLEDGAGKFRRWLPSEYPSSRRDGDDDEGQNRHGSVFGERSDALARDLGHGAAQLDLNPVHTRNGGRVVAPGWSKETGADIAPRWRAPGRRAPRKSSPRVRRISASSRTSFSS